MTLECKIISFSLPMPFKMGQVNCYLIDTGSGFILVDTGSPNARRVLELELERAGCKPGDLKLIVITHGDFDHTGNAAYLRGKYAGKIAMHPDDAGMAEKGDMFWNRKTGNRVIRLLAPMLFNFGRKNRFSADIFLGDETSLADYGCDATILSIPGHSMGSIGVLTASGDLISGDLFDNSRHPRLNTIMDDLDEAYASVEKLSRYSICTVYPGHGTPFPLDEFLKDHNYPVKG